MNAKDLCRCGHEREWHDSCSRCMCPFFLDKAGSSAEVKTWRAEFKARTLKEDRS